MSRVQFADVFIRDPVYSFPSVGSLQGRQNKGTQCIHIYFVTDVFISNTSITCDVLPLPHRTRTQTSQSGELHVNLANLNLLTFAFPVFIHIIFVLSFPIIRGLKINNQIKTSRFLFKQYSVSVEELSADSCPAEI